MPFSNFIYRGQWLEMRDSRLEQIIDLCCELLPEFVRSLQSREDLAWLEEAISEWKRARELPPGCEILKLDTLLISPERRTVLGQFFAFVGGKIRTTRPATDVVLATECERVQQFVESTVSRIWSGQQTA